MERGTKPVARKSYLQFVDPAVSHATQIARKSYTATVVRWIQQFCGPKLRLDVAVTLTKGYRLALLMVLLLLGVLSPAGALLAGAAVSPTDRAKNFWILCGRDGVPPAGSLELCKDILNAQRAGEAEAMEQAMSRLGDLPVAVEMAAAADGGRRFALPATNDKHAATATAAASRGGLLEFSELSFGEGGHGSKTWPAGVALSIWTQHNSMVKVPPRQ